jgi:caffeoyl-CoA O-methyltransferase
MPQIKTPLTQAIAEYLVRHSRQDEVMARVAQDTASRPDSEMMSPPDEAALITMLARLVGARCALEVGTFTGYGAIAIARGLVDGGVLTCLELSPDFAAVARANLEAAGVSDVVDIVVGPADESLRGMPDEPTYDFVYLDADKRGYPAYYDLIVPRLVPGGLLLIDNVLLRGEVIDPRDDRARIMDDLNTRISADERVDSVMILVADGLTLVRKR